MNIKQFSLIIAAAISLYAASTSALTTTTAHSKKETQPKISFIKPGAAVSLSHDYDGTTAPGGVASLTITLNHIYQEGLLTATIVPSPDMQIISGAQPVQSHVSAGSELTLYVQIATSQTGANFLGIETIYEALGGEQTRRVFAIPITVEPNGKLPRPQRKTSNSKSSAIIGLPAQETIK